MLSPLTQEILFYTSKAMSFYHFTQHNIDQNVHHRLHCNALNYSPVMFYSFIYTHVDEVIAVNQGTKSAFWLQLFLLRFSIELR